MKARGFLRLSILMIVMYLRTQCMAGNRWISRPDETTAVKEGSNVTLTWLYALSNNIQPERMTFGVWKSSLGYIETKLLLITRSELMVHPLVEGRMFFEGTLSNPGKATIKILEVSQQDSKAYAFEISTGLHYYPFEHTFELLVYNQTSTPRPTTSNKSKNKPQGTIQSFFKRFMTHILILTVVTTLFVFGICLCVAVLRYRRRRRRRNQGKTSCSKKRKTISKEQRTISSQKMYEEGNTEFELTSFAKFEVPCTLHDDVPPTMKTFGHRNNSVKSLITNQGPNDGEVHIYQDMDEAQGPDLPPRNSIKKTQQSLNRTKSSNSNNEKNTRSSRKSCREESTDDKACTTIEKDPNEQRKGIAKKREKTTEQKGYQASPIYDDYPAESSKRSKSTSSSTSVPYESDWELSPRNVYLCRRIGAGSFGQVWKGMLHGKYVAVKMLNERATRSDEKDLLSELEVMKTLKPHPNVVKLQGCITRESITCGGSVFSPPLVFLELVPYGDLLGYLRKSRGEDDDYYNGEDLKCPKRPTPQHLFSFANDVAKGMAFLAEKKIVHRDLAARNVLIGDKLRCKITDFGMARTLHNEDIYTKRSNGLFPVKWMAIESLLFQKYTTYSDVWSYGVVLYEIFTLGGRPYVGMSGLEVVEMIKKGKRLPRPPHVYSKLYSLMLQCWSKNPDHRPDFASLCKQVTVLAKDHQKYLDLKVYDHHLYVNVSTLKKT